MNSRHGGTESGSSSDQEDTSQRDCRTSMSSKSNKESLFEFLKRRKRGIQPQTQPHQLKKPLVESNRTFKSSLQSQQVQKEQSSPVKIDAQSHQVSVESDRSAGEATTRKTTTARGTRQPTSESSSPNRKADSPCFPPKHKQIVELFKELAQACNCYAQSGMQYRNHAESFMSQALELARKVEDPSLKSKLIDLRNCWRTVQSLFKDFQMMDVSETVNSMRLMVFQELQIDQDEKQELDCKSVQADDYSKQNQLQHIIDQLKDQSLKKLKQYNELEAECLQNNKQIERYKQQCAKIKSQVSVLQRNIQNLETDCQKYKQKVSNLQSKQLARNRTESKRRLTTYQQNKQNTIMLVDSITYQQKVDMEVTIREAKMQKHRKSQTESAPSKYRWQNRNLLKQLHESSDELYSYWSALKSIRSCLVTQKLYHRVSQHYDAIEFNDRLYM